MANFSLAQPMRRGLFDALPGLFAVRRWAASILALLLAGISAAHAQSSTSAVPPPQYSITDNSLGIYGPRFNSPQEAAAYVAAQHYSWIWPVDPFTLQCPARPTPFTTSDFTADARPNDLSAYTAWKPITRQWGLCTTSPGPVCRAAACVPDPTTHQYRMRAVCPVGLVFDSSNGKARCECPDGQELSKQADGNWACTSVCIPGPDRPDCYRQDLSCSAGNPVLPGIAAKVQTEVDYEGAGAHPLSFVRSFRSHGARPWAAHGGWSHWVHNWGRRVETYHETGWSTSRAYVIRGDASQLAYSTLGTGTWTATQTGDRNLLSETRGSNGVRTGFIYRVWADDSTEHYDNEGRLTRVVQRNGWTNTLAYNSDLLVSVKNHFGRELKFSYDASRRLRELLPPGATPGAPPGLQSSPIRYRHEEADAVGAGVAPARQLTSVTWQDGQRRRYHYENVQFPGYITGISDELGVRIGTYVYDGYGRVRREFGPGGANELQFHYPSNAAEITDFSTGSARKTVYTFEGTAGGAVRPTAVSAPCPLCGSSQARTAYTATGDVARSVGHDGKITFLSYDAKGRETERAVFAAAYNQATTRPALSLAERVTSTQWHPNWRLRLQAAEPGKLSSFQYDSRGNTLEHSTVATADNTGAMAFAAPRVGPTQSSLWTYGANNVAGSGTTWVSGTQTSYWSANVLANGDVNALSTFESGIPGTAQANLVLNAEGRLTQVQEYGGVSALIGWHPRGALASVSTPTQTLQITHDARLLPVDWRFSSGARWRLRFDALGLPLDLTDETGAVQTIAGLGPNLMPAWPQRLQMAALHAWQRSVAGFPPLPAAKAQPVVAGGLSQMLARALGQALPGMSRATSPGQDPDLPPGCCGAAGASLQPGPSLQVQLPPAQTFLLVAVAQAGAAAEGLKDQILILKSARKLKDNMCKHGIPLPPYCFHTHHIVHRKGYAKPLVQESTAILASVGIDVDDWANGAFVPCDKHGATQNAAYDFKVWAELTALPVKNRDTVTAKLQSIGARVTMGSF